jgi:signal transduction histidine kinase
MKPRSVAPQVGDHDLAGRLIASQETERTRIARDLHDGVCQELAALSLDVSTLRQQAGFIQSEETQKTLGAIQARIADIAEQLRLLSHGLHSTVLHHVGLVAALESHCEEIQRLHDVEVTVRVVGNMEPVSPAVALSLFRIAQEALQNAIRHGQAANVLVTLERTQERLTLRVIDDGIGFEVEQKCGNGGLGLVSIQERARFVHGRAVVRSKQGHGTSIEVQVPA